MIIVTGAIGFSGSCLISRLNAANFNAIVAVDVFDFPSNSRNLEGKKILYKIVQDDFFKWLDKSFEEVEFIFHLGTRTDAVETELGILRKADIDYSKLIWQKCIDYQIPLVYASATTQYQDEIAYYASNGRIPLYKPPTPYEVSENEFDDWVLKQVKTPFYWAGLRFCNVYGPNEYHKGKMASTVFHAFHQIRQYSEMTLFRSFNLSQKDGGQLHDFIYVRDLVEACVFMMHHRSHSGIYDLGSGEAWTELELARAVFSAMEIPENIRFVDTKANISHRPQYPRIYNTDKLKSIGFDHPMHSLEDGVKDYVQNYLLPGRYY